MNVGLIFGKFAPLTAGHVNFIRMTVESDIDHLYLFLSFDLKFNRQQTPWMQKRLGLAQRLLDLKRLIRDSGLENRVTVDYVDESHIPGYPTGGAAYAGLIREKIPAGVVLTHAFSSEPEYTEYFSEHFPEVEHVVLDAERTGVNISATRIRQDLRNNFNLLSLQAKPRFVKKVAIVGVESTGKSTLTKRLANYFQTNYTQEVGREICEDIFCATEDTMTRQDYLDIAMTHRLCEQLSTESAHIVTFSDTTNLITHFSGICSGAISESDPMFRALSFEESQYYDLVLYMSPEVQWVEDPLRRQNTAAKRIQTNAMLEGMVDISYGKWCNVVHITGSDYEDRFIQAVEAVEKCLKEV